MISNKKKVQLPIINIESRLEIEVIYPDYMLNRNSDKIEDNSEKDNILNNADNSGRY